MDEIIEHISVIVADRPYRLKVKSSEVATVEKAAEMIKNKMLELQKHYEVKDKQDYLAMSALTFAVESINNTPKQSNTKQGNLTKKLDKLDNILSQFLQST